MGKVDNFTKEVRGRNMRVLMILDNLSRDSGVSSIVMNLYKNITPNKIKIDFLAFKEGNNSYRDMVVERGSKVYILPNPLSVKCLPKAVRVLKDFFKEHHEEYDVVHLHSPSLNEFTLRYAKKYSIPNRVIHSHSTMTSPIKLKKYLNMFLQRNATKYANYYFSCSSEAAKFLYGIEVCKKKEIVLIKNAVDINKFKYSEQQAKYFNKEFNLEDKRVAIHVSNFSKIKNVSFLIEVIRDISLKCPDYRFLFVGDGPTKNNLEEIVKGFGLSKYCFFIGRRDDVANLLNCADVLLLPSLKEGLPVTVIEAQANGMKCIVSDTVTREANAGNVMYLPLKTNMWVESLEKIRPISSKERIHECEIFSTSEFNIINEAERVERIYLSMEDKE